MSYRGSKYAGYRDAADIARDYRRDVKAAQADPVSPVPADARISVRVEKFSGGQAIDVQIRDMPDAWTYVAPGTEPDYINNYPTNGGTTPEATAAIKELERLLNAYNRNNSDPQTDYFDVLFYGRVDVQDERQARFEAAELADRKARRRVRKGLAA